jgi:tripartite-type tricarboxylate transporter receptor subunit TctC
MTILKSIFATCALAVALPSTASAQYPDRRIDFVAPFAAGGYADTVSRLVAKGMAERLNVPVVVLNKPGAAGIVAMSAVSMAPADGYTLLLGNNSSDTINPNIHRNMAIDPEKAFRPVILVVNTPDVVVVSNDVKANSLQELIALAKANPGQLSFGTPGVGTTGHLAGELFDQMTQVDMKHIPYPGTQQAATDLVAGRIQVMFDNASTLAPLIKDHRIRALAITDAHRSPLLPEVPTAAEAGLPGFEVGGWVGVEVRAGTPDSVVALLNKTIAAVIETNEFKSRISGGQVMGGTPEDFSNLIKTDRARWADVTHKLGLVVD